MSFLTQLTSHLPLKKNPEEIEYFFALNIGLSQVSAAVWSLEGHALEILGESSQSYKDNEDLIEKTRLVLDESLGELEFEPEKILFGIPGEWNVGDNLKESYAKLLTRIAKDYDLEPLAYVATTHAISHLMQKQEGVPPTTVLLGLGDFLEITLLRGGKITEEKIVPRGELLFNDIEHGLQQLTETEVLPSRVVIYAASFGRDINKIKDELMTYPWMAKLSFLHFPKIDVLEEDAVIRAVVLAGAVELDPEVDLRGYITSTTIRSNQKPAGDNFVNLGFVAGDIEDLSKVPKAHPLPRPLKRLRKTTIDNPEISEAEDLEEDNLISPDLPGHTKSLLTMPGKKLIESSKIPLLLLSKISRMFRGISRIVLVPLVFLIILAVFYLLVITATVNVYIEPRVVENAAQVVADPKAAAVNEEQKIIPGSLVEVTETGTSKGTASGSKQIGDPARGQILIYNKTDSGKTLAVGTVLVGPQSLKFVLDTAVTVASQSAVDGGISFGKVAASVTASAIGPDSNLPAGTELSFTTFPNNSFSAKVDQSLAGGASKTVMVVTSDDQKKLQASLLSDLRQKAVTDLQGKLTDGKKVIAQSLAVIDSKNSFNKQVNDQAIDLSLNSTVKFRGTAYSEIDLRTIVSKLVSTQVPDGFELNLPETETSADVEKIEKDGRLIFQAKFKAKLMPKLNLEELKNKIKGKTIAQAAEILQAIDNVIGSEIILRPSLPTKIARLPLLSKNISITVSLK